MAVSLVGSNSIAYDVKTKTLSLLKKLFLIDGGHREKVIALVLKNKNKFPLLFEHLQTATCSVRLIVEVTPDDAQKYFDDINGKRKQPEPSLTDAMSSVRIIRAVEDKKVELNEVNRKDLETAVLSLVWDRLRKNPQSPFFNFVNCGAGPKKIEDGKPQPLTELVRTTRAIYKALMEGEYFSAFDDIETRVAVVQKIIEGWWAIIRDNLPECFDQPEQYCIRSSGSKVINQTLGCFMSLIVNEYFYDKFATQDMVDNKGRIDIDKALEFARKLLSQKNSNVRKGCRAEWVKVNTASGQINLRVYSEWKMLMPPPTWTTDGRAIKGWMKFAPKIRNK
jgi:hypothetical protein